MKTRDKILLAIVLAFLVSWLFGCGKQDCPVSAPSSTTGETDTAYLERVYRTYNDGYFQNRLTQTPKIDMDESQNMATTICKEDGSCFMHFNFHYVAAPRVARYVMLHEMCHIKTWDKDMQKIGGNWEQVDHGKVWRSCMLQLDAEGAFREILIDNYEEGM